MIIKCKLNVLKIDKTKLFKGEKGTYLDISLLENRGGTDQYGNDGMIVQDVTKLERQAGKKGAILGNFKIVDQRPKQQPGRDPVKPNAAADGGEPLAGDGPRESDDVPF